MIILYVQIEVIVVIKLRLLVIKLRFVTQVLRGLLLSFLEEARLQAEQEQREKEERERLEREEKKD